MGISIINFDAPLRSFKFTNQQTLRITERLKQKQRMKLSHMGVSKNSGTPKTPQNGHF